MNSGASLKAILVTEAKDGDDLTRVVIVERKSR